MFSDSNFAAIAFTTMKSFLHIHCVFKIMVDQILNTASILPCILGKTKIDIGINFMFWRKLILTIQTFFLINEDKLMFLPTTPPGFSD